MTCDHLDPIQHKPTWADGAQVPSVGFAFHEIEGEELPSELSDVITHQGEGMRLILPYILAGKTPTEIGLRAVAVGFRLKMTEHSSVTAQADAFGWTKQRFGKHLKKAEQALPLHGLMSSEQRQRMSEGKKRGRRGVKPPPATQLAGATNQSEQKPYTDKDMVNGGQNL